jgi:hypothetical protein
MRTASPGRKPNSAKRRPTSAGAAASLADTETTRAVVPGFKSVKRISPGRIALCRISDGWVFPATGSGMELGGLVDMDAILYENRSHYYYAVTLLDLRLTGRLGAVPANLEALK